MLVTRIRHVTRQKYRIEAEGLPPFVLYKGEVSRYHIEEDKDLSMETYREILEEVLIKRAKLRTLRLLEQGDRTKKGLENKLEQNGYPPEAVEESAKLGFQGRHLIAMQGPFSREMNLALLRYADAAYFVTKESGKAGGFEEKLEAARQAGAVPVVIGRPREAGESLERTKEILLEQLGI